MSMINNPGITKAKEATSAVNGKMVVPEFINKTGKTDFNDMHIEQGLDAVNKHVLSQINNFVDKSDDVDLVAAVIDPAQDFTIDAVLKHFVVIYGQGVLIYDSKREIFMSATDFRIAVGNDVNKQFFADSKRKMVQKKNVRFSPGAGDLLDGYLNLFKRLPFKPKKGKCDLLLDILFHLCGEDKVTYDWTLKWLAYPLQNVGAKMATAIVIHGREGTGKNLFLSAIQRIYGDYTSIITQNDIESNFNGWASRKLFIVANEVVSRQEMFHKKGIMKNMITEPEWNINEKNINSRKEANHANFVFCSNFLQPVAPDKDDRRYLILWSPSKQDKVFYKAVAHERDNGGVEALYHYLLNYDLSEYDEYTEPVMTNAKLELIMLSMKSDERFIEMWLDGDLPLPLLPVLTSSLYQEYQNWCKREGEKFYVSSTEFGAVLGKHELINKKNHQRYFIGARERKGTFVVPYGFEPGEGVSTCKWLTESNDKFNDAVSALKSES